MIVLSLINPSQPQIGELTQLGIPHHHILGWGRVEPEVKVVLGRLQSGDNTLTREELDGVAVLAKSSYTVTLSETKLQEQFSWLRPGQPREVVDLARNVQTHNCTKDCRPGDQRRCSKSFPRPPSILTMVSRLPNLPTQEDRSLFLAPLEDLQIQVELKLCELKEAGQLGVFLMKDILYFVDSSPPLRAQDGSLSWGGMTAFPGPDLAFLLARCLEVPGLTREEVERMTCWHYSLLFRTYPRVVSSREVAEVFTVNYSPAILLCTQGNHEVEVITSTPSRVVSYVTKGGGAASKKVVNMAVRELQGRGEEEMATRLKKMVEEEKMRVVSLTEAIYSLTPSLSLSSSNIGRRFVWVGERGDQDVDGDEEDNQEDMEDTTSDYGLR